MPGTWSALPGFPAQRVQGDRVGLDCPRHPVRLHEQQSYFEPDQPMGILLSVYGNGRRLQAIFNGTRPTAVEMYE
ncbi:MAG: hypothetical protein AAFN12_08890 [Cyanobacteria bacterium J06560_2]